MSLKEILKQSFADPKVITFQRYNGAKFAFIITSFLFFINFYFIGVKFYSDFFTKTLGISYILLLISLLFFIYFFIKLKFIDKLNKPISMIIFVFLFVILIILLLPVIIQGNNTLDIINK